MRRIASLSLLVALLVACQNVENPAPEPAVPVVEGAAEVRSTPPNLRRRRAVGVSRAAEAIEEEPLSYDDLWERMRDGFLLTEYYDHPSVAEFVRDYSSQQRYFDLMQERSSPFLFGIVEEIDRRGLPMEFALLPMVESTYNPNAYSSEHAVGLWQFLGSTGSSFGLQQDWWFDARRDPHASTVAALDYMEQLYQQFNEDWLLAIAAYNTGDGNLRRAIRNNDNEDTKFWDLSLPGETEAHVPKLLALAAIVYDAQAWGIELQPLPNEPVLRSVEIGSQIDISQAASLAGIEYEELRALNPGYLQWATHPEQPQRILLPIANATALENALTDIDTRELLTWDRYEIQPGDTLGAIARRLGTRVDILQTFNSLSGSRIVAGDSLMIPRSNDPELLAAAPRIASASRREPSAVPQEYTVRNGDNLWAIARRFDLRSSEIAAWNGIALDQLLQPGQVLDLSYAREEKPAQAALDHSASASSYVVRRGDSMDAISRRFGIDLQNLLLWNDLSVGDLIFPGQELQVADEAKGSEQI